MISGRPYLYSLAEKGLRHVLSVLSHAVLVEGEIEVKQLPSNKIDFLQTMPPMPILTSFEKCGKANLEGGRRYCQDPEAACSWSPHYSVKVNFNRRHSQWSFYLS
jgi:hypothetical protein